MTLLIRDTDTVYYNIILLCIDTRGLVAYHN